VNFGFDEDQERLRAAAEQLLAAESTPALVRSIIDEPEGWRSLWKTIVNLGWTGLLIPEDLGGLGLGTVDVVALTEVAGRWVLPAPFVSSAGVAASVLADLDGAGDAQAAIASGSVVVLAGASVGDSTDERGASGPVSWDGVALRGTAPVVSDATRADLFVVIATPTDDADGDRLAAVVPSASAGVAVEEVYSVDPTRPLATVRFDGAEPVQVLRGRVDTGLDRARAVLAAELVGICDRLLEVCVEHASTRTQFGVPIGSFQAVKHRLADVYVATERARTLTYNAAMVFDDPDATAQERAVAAAMAKAAASEAGVYTAKSAVQVHGAIGMTWEHDLHLFTRRARHSAAALGDHRTHYRRVGAALIASHSGDRSGGVV
jgi:alkylation response protein AidB-like acyl-CoA dehydrogenase